jgi:hypothetical protein
MGGRNAPLRRERDARPVAQAGKIDATLSDALGRAVATLHGRASAVEAKPWIAALADYIEQNDAAFRERPDLFPPTEATASAEILGVPFHGLFLDADLDIRVARVTDRSRDASDADAAIARLQETYDLGALDWTRIDASGTPDETLARARAAMGR